MQTFKIECEDLRLTPELIAALLQTYFEKLEYPVRKIIVEEI